MINDSLPEVAEAIRHGIDLKAEVAEAIRLIRLRIAHAAKKVPTHSADIQEHSDEGPVDINGSIGKHALAEDVAAPSQETDHDLEEALEKSELEALWQEQEDVTKTILHSKTDCRQRHRQELVDGVEQPDGLVLLCFQSCRKELYKCLLESPMAAQLADDGALLQPDFAAGRLILAKGVTAALISEARGPWHVAVRVADEGEVYDILQKCLGRQRPRVMKEDGRFLVPGDISLFDDTSSSIDTAVQPQWWDVLDIKRTFLHTKPAPKAVAKRALSAPPAIPSLSSAD